MRYVCTLLVIFLSLSSFFFPARAAGASDCATSLSEEEIENLRLRKEMDKAREIYSAVDAMVSQSEVDYRGLAMKTDELMATVRSLQVVAGASSRKKTLEEMIRDIKALQVMATSRSASGYRNGLNALYENCFRCHLTHSSPRPVSPAGPKESSPKD